MKLSVFSYPGFPEKNKKLGVIPQEVPEEIPMIFRCIRVYDDLIESWPHLYRGTYESSHGLMILMIPEESPIFGTPRYPGWQWKIIFTTPWRHFSLAGGGLL